jgi:hypothetical protein
LLLGPCVFNASISGVHPSIFWVGFPHCAQDFRKLIPS